MPVNSVALSPKKDLMAVCLGYDWHQGVHGLRRTNFSPEIYVAVMDKSYFTRIKMYM